MSPFLTYVCAGEGMILCLTDRIWVVEGSKNGGYPFSCSLYIPDGGGGPWFEFAKHAIVSGVGSHAIIAAAAVLASEIRYTFLPLFARFVIDRSRP
jgi:hypothetical protein